MSEIEFRIKTKLIGYRSERSSEERQINLVFYPDKKNNITFCFSSENYEFEIMNMKEKLLKIC